MMLFLFGMLIGFLGAFGPLLAMTASAKRHNEEMRERIEAMRRLIHRYDEDDCA
jgi:gas vesicle protein